MQEMSMMVCGQRGEAFNPMDLADDYSHLSMPSVVMPDVERIRCSTFRLDSGMANKIRDQINEPALLPHS